MPSASPNHRQAVKQGATGDITDTDKYKHGGGDAVDGVGGTGGSSGAGSERNDKADVSDSGIEASEGGDIDRDGNTHADALQPTDANRAGKTRQEEIDEKK